MSAPSAHIQYLDGNRFLANGDLAGAEICYLRALLAEPGHVGARANLGVLKERQGRLGEAEQHYRLALALMPGHAQLHLNLGIVLLKSKRFADGEELARRAVQLAPESVAAWNQLGVLLACVKREAEAEQCYRHALALAAADANKDTDADAADAEAARARFNLAYLLLRQGRYAEGWPLLESRWQFDPLPQRFDCPRWEGEPLAGKSLVIGLEAGQGDMIHFCRYAALAKAQGAARIAVVCHPSLKTLFATLPGVDEVHAYDEAAPVAGWDYWTLPMSMPARFGTALDTIPAPIPYLFAAPALVERWAAQLPAARLRVGLAWKGNPQFENDAERSLPSLQTLAPVIEAAASGGIQLVSLQKGPGEEEARTWSGASLHAIGPQLRDFADTAAVIEHLDLVISIDSAVAHLAGAMGKPCWLLLPDHRCDWRWRASGDSTPWYPSMRLFRQPAGGGWDAVIAAVAADVVAQRFHNPGPFS